MATVYLDHDSILEVLGLAGPTRRSGADAQHP